MLPEVFGTATFQLNPSFKVGGMILDGERSFTSRTTGSYFEDIYYRNGLQAEWSSDRFDVTRNPDHQAFGAGGRHFCLGTALARLELQLLFEETLARFPAMTLDGAPTFVESAFLNQMKTLPVRLSPTAAPRRFSARRAG